MKEKDAIRPDHYNVGDPYEPRRIIKALGLGFNLGNTIKYVARAGKKDPAKHIEDLEKAKRYIEMEIEDLNDSKEKIGKESQPKIEIADHYDWLNGIRLEQDYPRLLRIMLICTASTIDKTEVRKRISDEIIDHLGVSIIQCIEKRLDFSALKSKAIGYYRSTDLDAHETDSDLGEFLEGKRAWVNATGIGWRRDTGYEVYYQNKYGEKARRCAKIEEIIVQQFRDELQYYRDNVSRERWEKLKAAVLAFYEQMARHPEDNV